MKLTRKAFLKSMVAGSAVVAALPAEQPKYDNLRVIFRLENGWRYCSPDRMAQVALALLNKHQKLFESPDGRRIFYTRDGGFEVYLIDLRPGNPVLMHGDLYAMPVVEPLAGEC